MTREELLKHVIADKESKIRLYFAWYAFYWTVNLAGLSLISRSGLAKQAILMFMLLTIGSFATSCSMFAFIIARNRDIDTLSSSLPEGVPVFRPRFEYACAAVALLSFILLLAIWVWLATELWVTASPVQ